MLWFSLNTFISFVFRRTRQIDKFSNQLVNTVEHLMAKELDGGDQTRAKWRVNNGLGRMSLLA